MIIKKGNEIEIYNSDNSNNKKGMTVILSDIGL